MVSAPGLGSGFGDLNCYFLNGVGWSGDLSSLCREDGMAIKNHSYGSVPCYFRKIGPHLQLGSTYYTVTNLLTKLE